MTTAADRLYGVRTTPAWGRWDATACDFPDVLVGGAEHEVGAVRRAGRQIAAAATYFLQHGIPLPRPSRIEPDEWRVAVRGEDARATIAGATMPAEMLE